MGFTKGEQRQKSTILTYHFVVIMLNYLLTVFECGSKRKEWLVKLSFFVFGQTQQYASTTQSLLAALGNALGTVWCQRSNLGRPHTKQTFQTIDFCLRPHYVTLFQLFFLCFLLCVLPVMNEFCYYPAITRGDFSIWYRLLYCCKTLCFNVFIDAFLFKMQSRNFCLLECCIYNFSLRM